MKKLNKIYLGTNTKMNKTIAQTARFLTELHEHTKDISRDELELFVIPSFTTLYHARKSAPAGSIRIGAQNMGWADCGQFSGEISPIMLKEVGVEVVMIGHSERRRMLGETDEMENKKVQCALAHGLVALLCVGETEEERDYDISDEIIRRQLKIALHGVDKSQTSLLRIAYEPVWAIGINGTPATEEYVQEKHLVIRQTLQELFGAGIGERIPILYGGSVNAGNASALIKVSEVDGLFIGRSAWDAGNFSKIITNVLPVWRSKN